MTPWQFYRAYRRARQDLDVRRSYYLHYGCHIRDAKCVEHNAGDKTQNLKWSVNDMVADLAHDRFILDMREEALSRAISTMELALRREEERSTIFRFKNVLSSFARK